MAPSHWLVESQLHNVQERRNEGSLKWAQNMPEFLNWRLSECRESAKDRILWIKGPLGIGKSTMAGYYIDLLKCMYPKAIVAYFFCRSHEAGLTTARDILRTLAYQCIHDNPASRSVLEALKSEGFEISNSLGMRYLFKKLLLETVKRTQKEIYIVLDGLDEADCTSYDETDSSEVPDLHVLLTCLARLPLTRLLFVSRPNANVAAVVPRTTIKAIATENAHDIDAYVENEVAKSEPLRKLFNAENIRPVRYFREKGNGIFLWVILVINWQLAKANSRVVFRRYLEGFSAASGSMHKLYATILSRFGSEEKPWLKEILAWLVVAEYPVSVEELEVWAEWRLQDEHVDLTHFVEVNCGSILQLMPGGEEVRLIHETFRTFLLSEHTCPGGFFVDETETHSYAALFCLQSVEKTAESPQGPNPDPCPLSLPHTNPAATPTILLPFCQTAVMNF
jgi:NACHT domain